VRRNRAKCAAKPTLERPSRQLRVYGDETLAKDTEKLIRQLSLISYLMAERRPVTATEIRRDVEGYSDMTEDAFARRFYADRAELESLGIVLAVDKPADGLSEQEHYSLAREAFHLPAIAFTDRELASLQAALSLLDGQFAYAEPLRLALQQITWGRPSPLDLPDQQTIGLHNPAAAGGQEMSQRLGKIDTAIYRRKRIEFEYYSMQRDETSLRRVDPYHLNFEGGHFYLIGFSHERGAMRVFRLDRVQGKVAYATKAEHDFTVPEDFDPRPYTGRVEWQLGDRVEQAEVRVPPSSAWWVERHYARYGTIERQPDESVVFRTDYALPRLLIGWALGLRAQILGPPALVAEARERLDRVIELHRGEPHVSVADGTPPAAADAEEPRERRAPSDAAIRPERFARLVTLASLLIGAAREGRRPAVAEVCQAVQATDAELREDISVLNVVNFGGGTYVLYAEILPDGFIEVDTEPYSDTFDRPARLLPIEAKALIAAIDLLGEHLPAGSLSSARTKIVAALGEDPVEKGLQITSAAGDDSEMASVIASAIERRRVIEAEYHTQHEDRLKLRRLEPYKVFNTRDGWYVAAWDQDADQLKSFRLDRFKRADISAETFERRDDVDPDADIHWPRTGTVEGARTAHVWVSPAQARWAREERGALAEMPDGGVVVEWSFKGPHYLVRAILEEAGDAAVLEPGDVREAVLAAAERLVDAVR
jgi:proteasome accessory factor BC